jgi:hypothetical protein
LKLEEANIGFDRKKLKVAGRVRWTVWVESSARVRKCLWLPCKRPNSSEVDSYMCGSEYKVLQISRGRYLEAWPSELYEFILPVDSRIQGSQNCFLPEEIRVVKCCRQINKFVRFNIVVRSGRRWDWQVCSESEKRLDGIDGQGVHDFPLDGLVTSAVHF